MTTLPSVLEEAEALLKRGYVRDPHGRFAPTGGAFGGSPGARISYHTHSHAHADRNGSTGQHTHEHGHADGIQGGKQHSVEQAHRLHYIRAPHGGASYTFAPGARKIPSLSSAYASPKSRLLELIDSASSLLIKRNYYRDGHGRFAPKGMGGGGGSGVDLAFPGGEPQHAYSVMASGGSVSISANELVQTLGYMKSHGSINLERLSVEGKENANLFNKHLTNFKRDQMPQLPEDAAGMQRWSASLAKSGAHARTFEIDPRKLRASQNELNSVKVAAIHDYLETHGGKLKTDGGTLIVSRELGVVDGHHRWAATAAYAATHPGTKVKVMMIDQPIRKVLKMGRDFDAKEGIAAEGINVQMHGAGAREAGLAGIGGVRKADNSFHALDEKPTGPPPNQRMPYVWLAGQWHLIATDATDARDYSAGTVSSANHPSTTIKSITAEAIALIKRGYVRDAHGRFAPSSTSGALASQVHHGGGFTYDPVTKSEPRVGHVVSTHEDREEVHSKKVTPKEIRAYMKKNASLFNGKQHVGAWYNPEDGKTYLDIVTVEPNRRKAIALAKQHHQEAIYDLGSKQTIYTRARKEAATKAAPSESGYDGRGTAGDLRSDQRGTRSGLQELLAEVSVLFKRGYARDAHGRFARTGSGGGASSGGGGGDDAAAAAGGAATAGATAGATAKPKRGKSNYEGMSATEVEGALVKKYPMMTFHIKENTSDKNARDIADGIDEMIDAYPGLKGAYGMRSLSVEDRDHYEANYKSGGETYGRAIFSTQTVTLNGKYFKNDIDTEKARQSGKMAEDYAVEKNRQTFHPRGTYDTSLGRSVVVHEIGHLTESTATSIANNDSYVKGNVRDRYRSLIPWNTQLPTIARGISRYAGKNERELWAEGVTQNHLSKRKSAWTKRQAEFLDEVIGRKSQYGAGSS